MKNKEQRLIENMKMISVELTNKTGISVHQIL